MLQQICLYWCTIAFMKRDGFATSLTQIRVIGVGGGGISALNRMIKQQVMGIEFVAVDTDALSLTRSAAPTKLQLGRGVTRGLGANGSASVGERAACESVDELRQVMQGVDLLFLTAGMGGGTGSGVAPMLAEIAQETAVLTIAVVTHPFGFEAKMRQQAATAGIQWLRQCTDTVLVIPNDKILRLVHKGSSLNEALHVADQALAHAVQAMSDLVTSSGLINVDFADVREVLQEPGQAVMTVGQAKGKMRAREAVSQALSFPLLDLSLTGTKYLLLNISAGPSLTLGEIEQVVAYVQEAAGSNASLKFGAVFDAHLGETMRVTIVAKRPGLEN